MERDGPRGSALLTGWFGKIGLLLAAIAVGGLAAEGLVRLVAPQQLIIRRPDIWKGSDSLGVIHRPGVETTINTGERTVHVVTDSLGRRIGRSEAGGRADHRVLLLGDSFTEAFQVEYRDSFSGILERALSRRLEGRVELENTAVGAWAPHQYLREARASLGRQSYDLVVVFLYVGNDVLSFRPDSIPRRESSGAHELRLPDSLTYREIIDAWLYPINDFLEVRSHAFILFKRAGRQLLRRLDLTAGYFPDILREEALTSERFEITGDICEDIAELAGKNGTPTVFVLIPARFQVNEERLRKAIEGFDIDPEEVAPLEAPNRRLAEELRGRDLRVVETLARFREADGSGPPLYGSVDTHLSPHGHQVLADHVEPHLVELLRRR